MKKGITILSALIATILISSNAMVFASENNEKENSQKQETTGKENSKFYGKVEKIPQKETGTWTIKGRQVVVDQDTDLEGDIKLGSYVKVKGKLSGNIFTAREIELKKEKVKDSKQPVKLNLNGGKKWQADQVTRQGINKISYLVDTDKDLSLKQYNELSNKLILETDQILNNITMRGQSLDEVVKLMIAVIDDIRVLRGNDPDKSHYALHRLEKNTEVFSKYFEA